MPDIDWFAIEDRIADMLSEMSPEEQFSYLYGNWMVPSPLPEDEDDESR